MDISVEKLEQAVGIRRQMDALQKRLDLLFSTTASNASTPKGRGRVSATTRAKLTAAARARWVTRKGGIGTAPTGKRKSGLTPAGRKKLSQLMKARSTARKKAAGRR
jgi:hypothetical protein